MTYFCVTPFWVVTPSEIKGALWLNLVPQTWRLLEPCFVAFWSLRLFGAVAFWRVSRFSLVDAAQQTYSTANDDKGRRPSRLSPSININNETKALHHGSFSQTIRSFGDNSTIEEEEAKEE